jgi:hypothetical protein
MLGTCTVYAPQPRQVVPAEETLPPRPPERLRRLRPPMTLCREREIHAQVVQHARVQTNVCVRSLGGKRHPRQRHPRPSGGRCVYVRLFLKPGPSPRIAIGMRNADRKICKITVNPLRLSVLALAKWGLNSYRGLTPYPICGPDFPFPRSGPRSFTLQLRWCVQSVS